MPKNSRGGKAGSSTATSQNNMFVQQRAAQVIRQTQTQAQQQGFNPLTQTQIKQNAQAQDDYLAFS